MSSAMNSTKFSLSLPASVYAALASEAKSEKRDALEFMRTLLIQHAMASGFLAGKDASKMKLQSISDRAAHRAEDILGAGGSISDLTLQTIKACRADPDWIRDYRKFIGGDEFTTNNSDKASLNQNIGYYVKRAVGAEVDCDESGKRIIVKVPGEIIKSYTQLRMP